MAGENNNLNNGISNEELILIPQLKENVKDILPQKILSKSKDDQDLFFVRWIRARENNLEKATDMLRKHLIWREENNADEAVTRKLHPFFLENYPISFPGVDKQGQPILCIHLNEWDFRKVCNDPDRMGEFDGFITNMFETALQKIETEHKNRAPGQPPITQMTLLADAKNFPYGQLLRVGPIKKIMQLGSVYEAHYPEIVSRIRVIGCPSYFSIFLNILKPVIAPKTYGKIKCHASMATWEKEMDEIVDPAILQPRFGGILKPTN